MSEKTKFETMTRRQKSALLYVEHCAVDAGGQIDHRKVNQEDLDILNAFDDEGLIDFREIAGLCRLTERAMALAAQCRLERARNAQTVLSADAEAYLASVAGDQ